MSSVVASFDESRFWLLAVPHRSQMSKCHSAPELMCKGAWSLSMKINVPNRTPWQGWLYPSLPIDKGVREDSSPSHLVELSVLEQVENELG